MATVAPHVVPDLSRSGLLRGTDWWFPGYIYIYILESSGALRAPSILLTFAFDPHAILRVKHVGHDSMATTTAHSQAPRINKHCAAIGFARSLFALEIASHGRICQEPLHGNPFCLIVLDFSVSEYPCTDRSMSRHILV